MLPFIEYLFRYFLDFLSRVNIRSSQLLHATLEAAQRGEMDFILVLFHFLSPSLSVSFFFTSLAIPRNHACAALIYNALEIFIQGSESHRFPSLVSALRHFSYSVRALIFLTSLSH